MSSTLDILLVDDEPTIRLPVSDAIRARGHRVRTCTDGAEAMAAISAQPFDILICDIRLPKVDGLTIFRRMKRVAPNTDVVLITAYAAVPDAVAALKEGAADYITKPFTIDELIERLCRLEKQRSMANAFERARQTMREASSPGLGSAATSTSGSSQAETRRNLVGRSPAMLRLLEQVETFATSDAPVLISGESGTGKELVAEILHEWSTRKDKPFVVLHCAAFPETLIEAELFGFEKGAFTGAVKAREGRFKAAHGGTLFLDEVAEIPLSVQAKLLRVLQTGFIEPLGTNQSLHVDVRIISATHRDLQRMIQQGQFREDLYYRLNVLDVEVPALRERRADIPMLVQHFFERFCGGKEITITPRALAALADYPFPGNVRELEHSVQRAIVLARSGKIDLEHLPTVIAGRPVTSGPAAAGMRPLGEAVQEFEREYVIRALRMTQGRKLLAAEMLGVSRKSLWKKLRQLGISEFEYQVGGAIEEEEDEEQLGPD